MLVAVGLVVLMMSLFATIFQFATQSMGTQKGTAENDQKVRLVMTLLRNDIANRTMQDVGPFAATEDLTTFPIEANTIQRQGYVYIAENDPDDDTDDNLQLTVTTPTGEDPFYGAARVVLPNAGNLYGQGNTTTFPNYPNASNSVPQTGQPQLASSGSYWTNQPEFDDGILGLPNGAGSSPTAEVSYFLRKGTLYRRVVLIRTVPTQATMPPEAQPRDNLDVPLRDEFYGSGAIQPRNFFTYFDYSGFPLGGVFQFHSTNTGPNSLLHSSTYSIGNPAYRFGFNVGNGRPREYISNGTTLDYIGRFTHEETSFMSTTGAIQFFGYPGKVGAQASAYPNPMDDSAATGALLTYNQNTGKVNEYAGGSRIGEDILMTNVMRFDIKVWDDGASFGPDGQPGFANDDTTTVAVNEADDNQAGGTNLADIAGEIGWPGSDDGAFVDLGHNGFSPAGVDVSFYSRNRLNNNFFCPPNPNKAGTNLYRFDTWNVAVNYDGNAAVMDEPPFRAPNAPAVAGFNPRRRPLKAIQIKITFLDPTTQQLRDVTLVASLKPQN